jgi:YHS domain-containing protein
MIVEYDCIVCKAHCRKSRSIGNMKVRPMFCSQKCSGKFKTANKKGIANNFKGICLNCKLEFETYRSPSTTIPKFCSLKCLGEFQKGENNPAYTGGKHILKTGYYVIIKPDHPQCDTRGYVLEHRFVMECKLGRYLNKGECVHHIDGNKTNNDPSNLMLFKSQSEHIKYHSKLKKENK